MDVIEPVTEAMLGPAAIVLGTLAVVLAVGEAWVLFVRQRQGWSRAAAVATNIFTGVLQQLAVPVSLALYLPLFAALHRASPVALPVAWWVVPLALLLADFFDYWSHRISHENRILWALGHSVHHSSNEYDASVGLRVSWVEGFIAPIFYLPAALLVDPAMLFAALGFTLLYQQWLHTSLVGRLGWLDRWFDTPSNHRVHHGSNPAYLDKNYGSLTMVWDRLFGTYAPLTEPPRFGLTEPVTSHHPWEVHFAELRRLWRGR
jgi:sterol desaturase/sphingolipid hydroxylase (fatty acid hydroxylase superfamily)